MGHTVAYVRVSTEDQVEFSPDAQAKRCRELARLRNLGPVRVLADEGWSGKSMERPAMRELLRLIEAGEVSYLVIWRWDRLSRDQGDFSTLVKLFERHGVKVHSVNEGELDPTTASGKMQIGVHGVFAQYYRDHIVENVHMGMRQAAEQGRWQNRAPTGYDMVNGELVPNEIAPLVLRIFELRAAGKSYPAIESEVGFKYSTVRHICGNRVYLGETRLRDEWFPGNHPALITLELFNAASRGHIPGRRRSKDLLSGKARCGLCGRVAGIEYNERNEGLYRCKHRGRGCEQPGRSAKGLLRAAVIGLQVVKGDKDLQEAIRDELTAHQRQVAPVGPSVAATISALRTRVDRLLHLYYAGKVSDDTFAGEEKRLTTQIATLEAESAARRAEHEHRDDLAERFEEAAELLASFDLDALWEEATADERQTIIDDLVDSVFFYPDQITVQVLGAPPILVNLEEAGLRVGTRPSVSVEGRARWYQHTLAAGDRRVSQCRVRRDLNSSHTDGEQVIYLSRTVAPSSVSAQRQPDDIPRMLYCSPDGLGVPIPG